MAWVSPGGEFSAVGPKSCAVALGSSVRWLCSRNFSCGLQYCLSSFLCWFCYCGLKSTGFSWPSRLISNWSSSSLDCTLDSWEEMTRDSNYLGEGDIVVLWTKCYWRSCEALNWDWALCSAKTWIRFVPVLRVTFFLIVGNWTFSKWCCICGLGAPLVPIEFWSL